MTAWEELWIGVCLLVISLSGAYSLWKERDVR